ncbi:MAG: hypothetical protein WCE83_05245 [Candidatus Baltobacteraceae bacterium]
MQDVLRSPVAAIGEHDSDAHGHEPIRPGDAKRGVEGTFDASRQLLSHRSNRHVAQEDREFVATESGNEIAGPHDLPQTPRDLDQQFVSRRVPERVVEVLEPIEIDVKQRESAAPARVSPQACERLVKLLHELQTVGELRQAIVRERLPELALDFHAPSDLRTKIGFDALLRFSGTFELGDRPPLLDDRHRSLGHARQCVELLRRNRARHPVDDADGPERLPFLCHERDAGEKTDERRAGDQRIGRKTFVTLRVGNDEDSAGLRDRVSAERHVARHLLDIEPDAGLEPLPLRIDQAH